MKRIYITIILPSVVFSIIQLLLWMKYGNDGFFWARALFTMPHLFRSWLTLEVITLNTLFAAEGCLLIYILLWIGCWAGYKIIEKARKQTWSTPPTFLLS